jgi:hypothetical protein
MRMPGAALTLDHRAVGCRRSGSEMSAQTRSMPATSRPILRAARTHISRVRCRQQVGHVLGGAAARQVGVAAQCRRAGRSVARCRSPVPVRPGRSASIRPAECGSGYCCGLRRAPGLRFSCSTSWRTLETPSPTTWEAAAATAATIALSGHQHAVVAPFGYKRSTMMRRPYFAGANAKARLHFFRRAAAGGHALALVAVERLQCDQAAQAPRHALRFLRRW